MAECPDETSLVAYFYGEDSTHQRRVMEAHVAACRACADELASFRSVEEALSVWTVPEVDRRFDRWRTAPAATVAAERDNSAQRSFRSAWSLTPAWGLTAAAMLAVAVGAAAAAINGFEVRYGDFAVTVGRPAIVEDATRALAMADGSQLDAPRRTAAPAGPVMMGALGASPAPARRETDIVLPPPVDPSGSGLEFTLVSSAPMVASRAGAPSDRLIVFGPESPEALLEEIRRRMAGRALPPQPGWSDIAQRFRLAQERDPVRVREDFADFIVRVAGRPGDVQPVAAAPAR